MNDKRAALITGASAGLGKEFATVFARDGHDVVLVARSEEKLRALAKELEETRKVRAHVVAADLGARDGVARLVEKVDELGVDVGFLVNNAGFATSGSFVDLPLDREVAMVDLNITALVSLSHHYARQMSERGGGHILQIASTAGFQPGPYMATYYATKSFVVSFSEALAHELRHTDVRVTCYCPGATATDFAATAGTEKTALFQGSGVATAADVANDAYDAMLRGKVLVLHGARNWLMMEVLRVSPRAAVRAMVARFNLPV